MITSFQGPFSLTSLPATEWGKASFLVSRFDKAWITQHIYQIWIQYWFFVFFLFFTQNTEKKLESFTSFGDLFFLLYSITDRFSFLEARRLGRYIRAFKNKESTLILVGTKTDLRHRRKISGHEGVQLAKELGSLFCQISIADGYIETNSLFFDSLRLHLNNKNIQMNNMKAPVHNNGEKDKSGPFSWMREGFRGIYTRRKSIA